MDGAAVPATLVIFGGSGDLARRKLVPALYNLARARLLPATLAVVGAARAELTDDEFRAELHDAVARYCARSRSTRTSGAVARARGRG